MKTMLLTLSVLVLTACGKADDCPKLQGTWKRYTGEVISVSGCTVTSETFQAQIAIVGDAEKETGDIQLIVSTVSQSLNSLSKGTHQCTYSYNNYETAPTSITFECTDLHTITYEEN